jgi:serine/threonine-protein kinase HipA
VTIDYEALLEFQKADVYKAGTRAAILTRHDDHISFEYTSHYLNTGTEPVATTLPLTDAPTITASGAIPPFFAGLLPEGRRLSAIRRAAKVSADDDFTLLLAVGGDTIGDVQVVPLNIRPPERPATDEGAWNELDFADLYERSIGTDPELTGIAGVQEKLSGQMISFPTGAGRSILKLNPPEFPHIVENESLFLDAAAESGIEAARAEVVHDRNDVSGLLVERFDRASDDAKSLIAQEDGCQVLGLYPADKYRPTVSKVINGLASRTGAPTVAAYELVRQVLFSYLTGNGDLHAKNLSIYKPGDEWRPTPAYDVPSTYFYGDHTLALRIDDRGRNKDISRKAFLSFAESVNVSGRAATSIVDDQLDHSDQWLQEVETLPFNPRLIEDHRRFVANKIRLLAA